jgi:prevent-host-death family protein
MKTVGSRELKTRLGQYLRLVRNGATIVITDRGRPVAELRPIELDNDDSEAILEELNALGELSYVPSKGLDEFSPISIPGELLSQTILHARKDRI